LEGVRVVLAVVLCWSAASGWAAPPPCAAPRDCAGASTSGWCVETLLPADIGHHPRFNAIWSDAPDDVWAVGARAGAQPDENEGVAFHWDGCGWTESPLPTHAGLNDVWGAGPRDVWTVGATGVALHWTGAGWSPAHTGASATLNRVSGSGGKDVWAIGRAGLYHWNGRAWSPDHRLAVDARNEFLGDIWAVSPGDVWLAEGFNARGSVAHFDGSAWTIAQPSPEVAFGLFGVWSNGSVTCAVGEGDQVLRRAGGTWTQIKPPGGSAQGLVNAMGAAGDLYASGQTVAHVTAGGDVQAVAGLPAGSYPGLWVNGTQIWVAGSSNAGGAVIAHRAR
jgi:hypothetical protein